MKFYYNGIKLRTSEKHHYTHAIIVHNENGTITCKGCSSTKKGAEKLMNDSWLFRNYRTWLSVQRGDYRPKDRWSYSLQKMIEKANENYGSVDKAVEWYKNEVSKYEIVEVEERA